jgi:farnesyl diphosphate synthase
VLGLQTARGHAEQLRRSAHAALANSGLADITHLSMLADMVVDRES